MKTVVVTGSTGFIGSHLIPVLKKNGYTVKAFDRKFGDISDAAAWDQFTGADIVIHLAARSFVPASWDQISAFMQCNVQGTVEALNFCRKHNAHLIFPSSYLYGNPEKLPISEDAALTANNPYALSKKVCEDFCQFYSKAFGFPVTILRPFNAYGPGQNPNFLVPTLIRQIFSEESLHVKDLAPKRDFVYIDDVIAAILKAIEYKTAFDVFNIGSGTSYSVSELIDIIQTSAGTSLPVTSSNERRVDEIMDTVADIRKAKHKLKWEPAWDLSQGILEMIKAYRSDKKTK